MVDFDELDWDLLRVFLVAMQEGSLRAAAVRLGTSYPTARRHLGTLESQLGLRLFDRRQDGLHPTLEAVEILTAALGVRDAVEALARAAAGASRDLQGSIHVSVPEMLVADLLMPDLVEFTRRWPGVDLRVSSSVAYVDLDRGEADVALRVLGHGIKPQAHLAGRLAATVYGAVFGEGDAWIGPQAGVHDLSWIEDTSFAGLPVRHCIEHGALQRAACRAGLGLVILPCFMANPQEGTRGLLRRRTEPRPLFDIWVVVHPDLRRVPRLRLFRDFVVAALTRHQPRLEGVMAHGEAWP